jgi:hypothetical protein
VIVPGFIVVEPPVDDELPLPLVTGAPPDPVEDGVLEPLLEHAATAIETTASVVAVTSLPLRRMSVLPCGRSRNARSVIGWIVDERCVRLGPAVDLPLQFV